MKRLLSSFLASTLLLSFSLPYTTFSLDSEEISHTSHYIPSLSHGNCGENAFWSYDETTATLTISGTGAMEDYPNYAPPWVHLRDQIQTVVVESGITTIGWSAFHSCHGLTMVYLPDSLLSLEYGAFGFCSALESIYLPPNLTKVGIASFAYCTALVSITLPTTTTSIEDSAFMGCSSLSSLNIPSSLTYVGASAFKNCNALSKIYYQGTSTNRNRISIRSYYNTKFTQASWSYQSYTSGIPPEPPTSPALPEVEETPSIPSTIPDWAIPYADFVSESIMPDISAENYNKSASRGLVAQCLYHMYGQGTFSTSLPFTDAETYETAIAWCYENNLVSGVSDDLFGTEYTMTREQFPLVLEKLATLLEKNTEEADDTYLANFEDIHEISPWAWDGVAWAVSNHLLSGSENLLNPKGTISRIEIAIMLSQFATL